MSTHAVAMLLVSILMLTMKGCFNDRTKTETAKTSSALDVRSMIDALKEGGDSSKAAVDEMLGALKKESAYGSGGCSSCLIDSIINGLNTGGGFSLLVKGGGSASFSALFDALKGGSAFGSLIGSSGSSSGCGGCTSIIDSLSGAFSSVDFDSLMGTIKIGGNTTSSAIDALLSKGTSITGSLVSGISGSSGSSIFGTLMGSLKTGGSSNVSADGLIDDVMNGICSCTSGGLGSTLTDAIKTGGVDLIDSLKKGGGAADKLIDTLKSGGSTAIDNLLKGSGSGTAVSALIDVVKNGGSGGSCGLCTTDLGSKLAGLLGSVPTCVPSCSYDVQAKSATSSHSQTCVSLGKCDQSKEELKKRACEKYPKSDCTVQCKNCV